MSEAPPPQTADNAVRAFILLFVLGFVLRGVDVMDVDMSEAIQKWIIAGVLAVLDYFYVSIRTLLGPRFAATAATVGTDFRWWIAAALVLLAWGTVQEQQKWLIRPTVVHNEPAAEYIDTETASLRKQLSAAVKGQEDLQKENDRLRQALTQQQTASAGATGPSNLSASDTATKIGVWKTIDQRLNDLSVLLNQGYEMLDHWLANARSDRVTLVKNAATLASSVENFRAKLDELRGLYGSDGDIAAALRPVYVPGGRVEPTATIFLSLPHSLRQFSAHLAQMSDPLPVDIEAEMIPYIGAVRRDLNAVRDWQSQVRQIAAEQEKQLSRMHAK